MSIFERIDGERKGSVNLYHEGYLYKKATLIPSQA